MRNYHATWEILEMTKAEAMQHWNELEANQPIIPHFRPLPYKSSGSTYGSCGIRIDGNSQFIDAVLSRIKDLLACENIETRLGLSRNPVDGKGVNKAFGNADDEAECCYIRLHERGTEGKMARAFVESLKEMKRN